MGQLAHKLAESNIQPIFAVTKNMVKTYEVRGAGPWRGAGSAARGGLSNMAGSCWCLPVASLSGQRCCSGVPSWVSGLIVGSHSPGATEAHRNHPQVRSRGAV